MINGPVHLKAKPSPLSIGEDTAVCTEFEPPLRPGECCRHSRLECLNPHLKDLILKPLRVLIDSQFLSFGCPVCPQDRRIITQARCVMGMSTADDKSFRQSSSAEKS